MKKYELKLKDLDNISSKEPDHSTIMKELGYKNYLWNRRPRFARYFVEARNIINIGRQINPESIELNPDCKILKPNNIDNITLRAMLELRSVSESDIGENLTGAIVDMISIACFKTNHSGVYSSKTNKFKAFRQRILNSPLSDMMGLYNWIYKSLRESNIMWEKRFMSVEVDDVDYTEAGGHRMRQFNVLTTLKTLYKEFGYKEEEAYQKSYVFVQINSYANATQNHIQDEMRQIKERNMKRDRKRNGA